MVLIVDIAIDSHTQLADILVFREVKTLRFQCVEEALYHCIFMTVTLP